MIFHENHFLSCIKALTRFLSLLLWAHLCVSLPLSLSVGSSLCLSPAHSPSLSLWDHLCVSAPLTPPLSYCGIISVSQPRSLSLWAHLCVSAPLTPPFSP